MGLLSMIPNVYNPKKTLPGAAAVVKPTVTTPTPSNGINRTPTDGKFGITSIGATAGAMAGLPNGTIPTPTPYTGNTGVLQGPGIANRNVTIPNPTPSPSGIGAMAGAIAGLNANNIPNQYGGIGSTPYGPTIPTVSRGDQFGADSPVLPQAAQQVNNPMAATPSVTTPQPNLYQDPYARSREGIAKAAAERIAKILQAGRTAAGGALKGAKDAKDYTDITKGDSRSLRNFDNSQRGDQFGGSAREDNFRIQRQDNIQDTAENNQYNAQVGLINQKLADLEAAAPGDEQAIIDQLEQIERQTGINVAQLQEQQKQNQFNNNMATNQFNRDSFESDRNYNYNAGQDSINNNRNAANDAYNQSPNNPNNYGQTLTNQLNELKIGNYSTEQKQQAQLFEQELKSGKMNSEAAEYNLKQLKDPNSATNKAKQYDTEIKRLELAGLPETQRLELQKLKKTIADIGVVHYKPQTQAEINMDEQQLIKIKAEITKINKGDAPDAPKATDYKLNPKFSEDIAYIKANPASASLLDTEAQKFIDAYGYDGYKEMRAAAGLQD